ncbi:MAG TPA: Smr/MutS family protein [Bacilli bacterium]|jgi:DNA-nicking Smr family endonuclease|nr:Smr/MutS family protein [Bacilli bacterium]HPZ23651.1 Smr/MutS family protein [Bacilli bacterium]
MYKNIDPFLVILPKLDVHGYTEDTVMVPVNEFINDNYKLNHKKIYVIHGNGEHILKNKIHRELKRNKLVKKYYLYNFNVGCTIIELN